MLREEEEVKEKKSAKVRRQMTFNFYSQKQLLELPLKTGQVFEKQKGKGGHLKCQ